MAIVTLDATNVTETTARLNGEWEDADGEYCGFQWSLEDGDFENDTGYYPRYGTYYKNISGLTASTLYKYRAYRWYGGYDYGGTVNFTTDAAAPAESVDVAGSVTPSGVVNLSHQPPPQTITPAGFVTPSGALVIGVASPESVVAAGGVTPSGVAVVALVADEQSVVAAGGVTPSGVAAVELANPETSTAAGSVTPAGALKISVQHPKPPGGLSMAGKYDLVVEQGATFSRAFLWRNSSGVAVDLAGYNLRMKIRPFRGSSGTIATSTSGISITKSTTVTGLFTVSMSATVTAALDFVRAAYDIEAELGTVYRLVEGNVRLMREATV